ncbi:hypothetical protein BC832DRAFT_475924 [Gaertneriomyces semiglobifer]|nr:hypothetical protein BC832DRAFT_475924 [Gaertneriomyces semiglobifer]
MNPADSSERLGQHADQIREEEREDDTNDEDEQDEEMTAEEYLAQQESLVDLASEVLPGEIDKCSYDAGYVKQSVYACLTCAQQNDDQPSGVCYGCFVSCHTTHQVVELFYKRHFRCDCGTEKLPNCCVLQKKVDGTVNEENRYSQNFKGRFCWCGKMYDPEKEDGTMYQCLVCEDWIHDRCMSARTAASKGSGSDLKGQDGDEKTANPSSRDRCMPREDEEYVCRYCVRKVEVLRRYKDLEGFRFVKVDDREEDMAGSEEDREAQAGVHEDGREGEHIAVTKEVKLNYGNDDSKNDENSTKKRPLSSGSSPPSKKQKSNCLVFDNVTLSTSSLYDLFLLPSFRSHLCRCPVCISQYESSGVSFLLSQEVTHDPEDDPTPLESLHDRGMKALGNVERQVAIDGAQAYQTLKDELAAYLRPFAQEGRVVTKEDVVEWFQKKEEEREKAKRA